MNIDVSPTAFKAACNRAHTLKRAVQRYSDLQITREDIKNFEELIRIGTSDDCLILRPGYGGKERILWAVKHRETWLPVVFDLATDSAITILPEHALDPYRSKIDPVVVPSAKVPSQQKSGGKIVGFSPLPPPIEIPKLPPLLPEPSDDASLEDFDKAFDAAKNRNEITQTILRMIPKHDRRRQNFIIEKENLDKLSRKIKERRHQRNVIIQIEKKRQNAIEDGVEFTDDPDALLVLAFKMINSIGERTRWALTPFEFSAKNAITIYLSSKGLIEQ